MESKCWYSEYRRQKDAEKWANSWKHLNSKPYSLLAKYHKSLLEEFGLIGEDEDGFLFESEKRETDFCFESFFNKYQNKKEEFITSGYNAYLKSKNKV